MLLLMILGVWVAGLLLAAGLCVMAATGDATDVVPDRFVGHFLGRRLG